MLTHVALVIWCADRTVERLGERRGRGVGSCAQSAWWHTNYEAFLVHGDTQTTQHSWYRVTHKLHNILSTG